jgi:glycosyltransferase involved in cell wall biosynthesis
VTRLAFGIHLEGELDGIEATLVGIAAFDPGARPLLLADGLDPSGLRSLRELASARDLTIAELGDAGGAGAFERLSEAEADCLAFVEAGAEFGPRAIERLLAVLDDEAIGMAGPSFDRGWNEQAALREWVDRPLALAAAEAERLDASLDDLAPLYSLATGCLFVHRRTLARIGGVDRGYGLGPCWEMDLHVRCARAGLRGVWVPHAFVRRPAPTRLRLERERAGFETSRRRYQDRFCGLRRLEPLRPYSNHCRGDACSHFAPATSLVRPAPTRAIPKLVHLIWIGEREPPWECIESWTRDFVAAHPDWRVELWREPDIDALGLENAQEYANAVELCGKADVARYEIVWRRGGVYVDADSFWLGRPLEPLLAAGAETGFVGAREDDDALVMCNFFAATAGHPILRAVIDRLPARVRERPGARAWIATGPALLGEVVGRTTRASKTPLVTLVPAERIVARSWLGITGESIPDALAQYRREGEAIAFHVGYSTNQLELEQRPLVSCIMPTRDRAVLVERAIELFHRQDWPRRELVIVHEGLFPIGHLRGDPRIRLVRVDEGLDIGSKRNLGIEHASGDLLVQWDDDDWSAADRISIQVAPLIRGEAEVTAFAPDLFFHLERGEFWSVAAEQREKMFVGDVVGGTLAFTRAVWREAGGYPAASLAEDAALLRAMTKHGHRLARLANDDRYVYVRHGRNTWTFALTGRSWTRRSTPPGMPREDLAFYEHFARTALDSPGWSRAPAVIPSEPLVSCLMPTRDRPVFVEQAVRYFLRQTWERRELVVIDDGESSIADRLPDDPRIVHVRVAPVTKLGDKRNLACERARGDILVHWDDDDWHAAWRLHYQVARLHDSGAQMCGIDRLHYVAPWAESPDSRAWLYTYPAREPPWVAGGTLAYARELWERLRFRSIHVGEDNDFVARCPPDRLLRLADIDFYVGVIHPANTSPKKLADARWRRQSVSHLFTLLGSDADFYRELS